MSEYDFKEIKKKLSSSLRMKLDHIKRFLTQGNASVLVGAGFSKNAEMDASVCMKDWYSLGLDFYNRLYGDVKDSINIDPIRLASQIDASFGRNELDEMILNSIPDDRVYPGELHKSLLKLQWKDVFTTNYDTLLERAIIDAERHYEVVTNKETLLYKTSPRIIKLHGSFKNVRPFIMTEEDYRTYPFKHPEFVNTVRQSLIEGVLCLIGFSGNDPNFLKWVGWLRDVMGEHAAPVYLITFDKNLHTSELKLNDRRGISTINLADLDCFDYSSIKDAFRFLFQYLEENNTGETWNATFMEYSLENVENIDKTISQMSQIRLSYPGWILLPENHYGDFEDINQKFPFLDSDISLVKSNKSQLLSFLYELDWRLNISLSPKDIDWYVEVLSEFLNEYMPENQNENDKYNSLLISLLTIYRKRFDVENYFRIEGNLQSSVEKLNNDNLRRFFYEKALYYLSILDYESVKKILRQWPTLKFDYLGLLCKSSVYAEIGMENDAATLLNEALQNIRTQLLVDNTSPLLLSCRSLIEDSIRIYNYRKGYLSNRQKDNSFNFDKIVKYFKQNIQDQNVRCTTSITHDFNIGRTTTTWNLGPSGYVKSYLNSYRYLQAYESVGYPIGLNHLTINEADFQYVISNYIQYNKYALLLLVRLNNTNIVKKCILRETLVDLSTEYANKIFDTYYSYIETGIDAKTSPLYIRTGNVLLPLFSRLATKLSSDRIIKFLDLYIKNYIEDGRYYNKTYISTIYNCLSIQDIGSILELVYSVPINVCGDEDILLPQLGFTAYNVSKEALYIINSGLRSVDEQISNSAYRRLVHIYNHLSFADKEYIDAAIYEWRNHGDLTINKKYSLKLLPYNNIVDKFDIKNTIKDEVSKFVSLDKSVGSSSLSIQNMTRNLESLYSACEYITTADNERIIVAITEFLVNNKEKLSKDDSDSFFGGLRSFTNQLYNQIYRYIKSVIDWKTIRVDIIDNFASIIMELGSYQLKHLSIVSLLLPYSSILKTSALIALLENHLFSSNAIIRNDAANALIVLAEKNVGIQKLVKKIITFVELSQSESTSNYIDILTELFLIKAIGKEAQSEIKTLLNKLYNNVNQYPISEEYKTDIYYATNKLAGVISVLGSSFSPDMSNTIQMWKKFSMNENVFNDVRVGFEVGEVLSKKII